MRYSLYTVMRKFYVLRREDEDDDTVVAELYDDSDIVDVEEFGDFTSDANAITAFCKRYGVLWKHLDYITIDLNVEKIPLDTTSDIVAFEDRAYNHYFDLLRNAEDLPSPDDGDAINELFEGYRRFEDWRFMDQERGEEILRRAFEKALAAVKSDQ